MQNAKQICFVVTLLIILSMLSLTGCGKKTELFTESTTHTTHDTEEPEITETIPTTEAEDDASVSLKSLRQAMIGTPQLFAVAYFGYHDTMDSDLPVDPYEVMREYAYWLCEDLPFLQNIPADRVIGNHGELYCIVPLDENATVAVSKGSWDEALEQYIYEESIYYRESGEPILLFCNDLGWEPDTQVRISGPSGEIIWYPRADDNLCAMPLRNDNWDALFLDFSPYREILMKYHRDMKDTEWVMPTAEMLYGSTWQWAGFLKDGREVSYQLSFHGDTLSVQWNDGMDEEDHVYRDALWELTYDEGFAILSIDFGEMAGVLRYNLLYHEVYEQMYVAIDAVQEEMTIGWEPLYRFLKPPAVPEPEEMLGDWELAWTEVEGYRENVEPGTEYISIFLNDSGVFRITLTDKVYPKKSFKNKELGIYEGELYLGCGNDHWMAYIGYMGPDDIIHSLTLLPDDTLLMEMYWEIDGGVPMVAHKGYRRSQ